MKKIIIVVMALAILVVSGILGWNYWQKSRKVQEPEPYADEIWQVSDVDDEEDFRTTAVFSWEDLLWEGPDASDEYIDSIAQADILSYYNADNQLNHWSGYHLLGLLHPAYAINLYNRESLERSSPGKLFLNNVVSFTGRTNDLLLSMYARFRPAIHRVLSEEQFQELDIAHTLQLLISSYHYYAGEEEFLQSVYDALHHKKYETYDLCSKIEQIFSDFDRELPYDTDDEDTDCSEFSWAYSFWARRYGENNMKAVYSIISDLMVHYVDDMYYDEPIDLNDLNGDIRPLDEDGNYLYQQNDGALNYVYRYNIHGERTGQWIEYLNGKISEECRMENDMLQGEHKSYNDGKVSRLSHFINDTLRSSIFYDKDGHVIKSVQYKIMDGQFNESIDLSDGSTVTQYKKNNSLDGPYLVSFPDGKPKIKANYSKGDLEGTYERYYPSGKIQEQSSYHRGFLKGLRTTFFENGTIESEHNFNDGMLNGIQKNYYSSGQIKKEFRCINNSLDGEEIHYHENGNKSIELAWVKGIRNGEWKEYYPSGALQSSCLIRNNKNEGARKTFYEEGQLKSEVNWINGLKQGPAKILHPSGKVEEEQIYKDNELDGMVKTYDADGNPVLEIPYATGKRKGEVVRYFPSGIVSKRINFTNDKKNGFDTEYYESGEKKSERYWIDDKLQGLAKAYYPSGKVELEGRYVDNQPDGEFIQYKKNGKVDKRIMYKNGKAQ